MSKNDISVQNRGSRGVVGGGTPPTLWVKRDPVRGRGVFTKTAIAKGSFVLEYVGKLYTGPALKRHDAWLDSQTSQEWYQFYFWHKSRLHCLDATEEDGTLGRLLNHSRKHANLTPIKVVVDRMPRIMFVAVCDIPKHSQLMFDYGDRDSESLANFPWLGE